MVFASLAAVVEEMRKGLVPAVMSNGRIVELMCEGQKLVFGDAEETAWQLMAMGGFISMDSGFAHDLQVVQRREIVATIEHFVEWCEMTRERMAKFGARDEEDTLYCQLDKELAALAREEEAWAEQGKLENVVVMLGDENIVRRRAAAAVAHSGSVAVPDFAAVKRPNGLEQVVYSVLRCIHADGGHTKAHNFLQVALGPIYAGTENTIQLTQGSRDNFYGGFVATPVKCTASCASTHLRAFFHAIRKSGGPVGPPVTMAVMRCISVEPPTYTQSPVRAYDVTLGDKMVTDTMVARIFKAIIEAIKNCGKEGPRSTQPGLAGVFLVLNKVAGQESKLVITVRGELSAAARTLDVGDGRPAVLQEMAMSGRVVNTYVHVLGMGDDEAARVAVRDGLLKKVGRSTLGVEVSGNRDSRAAGVRGAFLIKSDEITQRAIVAEMYQVEDTESGKNMGYVTLTKEEASSMMVAGNDVKLVTAASPSFLQHALDKLYIDYQLWNGAPGGNSSSTQAEIAALREMMTEQRRAAEERQAAADDAFAQANARAAAEAQQMRQAMEGSKAQVADLGVQLKRARKVMQRAEESAGLRSWMEAAKSEARDAEMRDMVRQMAGTMAQQGTMLAALANSNPDALQALQAQQQGAIGMAPNVVGTNADGAPVIDLGALTGMGAQMQGGGAAAPPTAEVARARQLAEAAAAEFDKSRSRLSRAWTGESSSESEEGFGEVESAEGDTDRSDEEVEIELESELQEAMDAEATGVNLMDNDNHAEGARLQLERLGMAGWEHGDGRMVTWGGLQGYYNYFEYNGTLWLPRPVSADEDGEAPHEGAHARMGDAAASIAWGSSTAYAYFRRMQRLLGRQFASEHKARRKKYIGTGGSTGAREGSVGGTGGSRSGVRRAVLGAVTLAGFGSGGMWLRDVLGIYSDFDLRPGVNTLCGVAVGGAVTCYSESWLLQQRNVTGSVTLGRVEEVAGGRRVDGCGNLGAGSANDWWLDDGACAEGGQASDTVWEDGEARRVPALCRWYDDDRRGVDGGNGQVPCWIEDRRECEYEGGAEEGECTVRRACTRTRSKATVWWQVQGGAPPWGASDYLGGTSGKRGGEARGDGAIIWRGVWWAGGLLGVGWAWGGRRIGIARRGGAGRGGGWQRWGRTFGGGATGGWAQRWMTLLALALQCCVGEAMEGDTKERLMLFNTRGLAVSTSLAAVAAGTGYFLAQAALRKLAFIATTLNTKGIEAGVLLELICDMRQAKWLGRWFRNRGFGLRVASGDACERHGRKGVRNSVAVFYRLDRFKELKGASNAKYRKCSSDNQAGAATKLGERILRLALQRRDGTVLNLVAWHGCHDEARFATQMDAMDDLAESGCATVVLADVNRRLSVTQSSRASPLGVGDKRWGEFVGWDDGGAGRGQADTTLARLVPMLDEGEAAATRWATVGGTTQWSILDRCIEMGEERRRWTLDEIIQPEVGGEIDVQVSDHAAVCFERARVVLGAAGERKPSIPNVRKWTTAQLARYEMLMRGAHERVSGECGGDEATRLQLMDAEIMGAAELVELEAEERRTKRVHSDDDNHSMRLRWLWRLRKLYSVGSVKAAARGFGWMRHPRCELRHEVAYFENLGVSPEDFWLAMVRRCRREVAFYTKVCDEDRARAAKMLTRVAASEAEEDPLARAKLAFDMMRGKWAGSDKLSMVAVGDDPEAGFVTDPAGVRKEAAAIGHAAQIEYLEGNRAPDGAFDAFLEHFSEGFDELTAPDGSEFSLEVLLTFELFEEELHRHARYKAVGAQVGRALSSLELIRRLSREEREAYFAVAKKCILGRKFPAHWQQMVYVLLAKKHGDQRKLRKRREIALMDQTLKLMLKCVKRLSFDRMVGRTGEDNHGWVPGHGALNAALMMDVILGQARELKHSIYILFLDLKQFFPAIKRKQRTAAEYFIGLPHEVVRLAKAVFERMTAKFDTAHGLSDSFGILGGDLMGCVLSPSHARCLLTSISVAIAAVSSGVRVWGCSKRARHVAQTMMADDWAGFNTTEESLQAQWAVWVDYAMASGSPIGVAGLEKTVVTAAKFVGGKWVDVVVKLKIPRGEGGLEDLPEVVPQLPMHDAYPHMGILRSICGGRHHMRRKLRKGVAALVSKVRKVKFDKGQHIQCANCLKGSYVGYYAAAYGLTMAEAEELERIWRAVFRMVFKVHPSTPTAHFYGGKAEVVADPLHGRHVMVDAVGALYSTCRRALASPEDSPERALARSALARRARKWGCAQAVDEWLGSRQHLDASVVVEREMEAGTMMVEAFDFFLLYTAWLTRQDAAIFKEKVELGEKPPPLRSAMAVEHEENGWGEALLQDSHSAWVGGTSRQLHTVMDESPPAVFLLAGITKVEHLCRPAPRGEGAHGFEFLSFAELTKLWELPKSKRVFAAYTETCGRLRDRWEETAPWFNGRYRMEQPMVRPRTSRQLWDGVKRIGGDVGTHDGWPVGDGCHTRRGDDTFTALLQQARVDGLAVSKERWAQALQQSYPGVVKRRAVEWWDGAPTDTDRHGTILMHVWPGAEHRTGGGSKVFGRRQVGEDVTAGEEKRRKEAGRWSVGADGDLLVDGLAAEEGDADDVPCIRLLVAATRFLKEEEGVEIDRGVEVTNRCAGEWAIHVESTRRTLEEWKELHARYDIQVAAATDGGRQFDEHGHPVASAAGYTSDGKLVGGALDPDRYPSSYECELRALIEVVRTWPAGRRALLAVDARSPVMAVAKFRDAHVNKRAEYYQDDMLDELLRELERMEMVVFYWLKGHSGAVANEVADLQATRLLEEAPVQEGDRPRRRHASLTFAFDRRPFRWAAERITRHVRERMQSRSTRSIWRDGRDWVLRWGRGQAKRRRVLQAVQTRRLLLGDGAYYEGACGVRAAAVRCECGGGVCSSEHWMFDCCLPAAREQRSVVAAAAEEVGSLLACEGTQHRATEVTAAVLRGRAGSSEVARGTAMRWLVGCMPKPEGAGKEARGAALRALKASADSWRAAAVHYREAKEQFLRDEKDRTRAYRVVDRLRMLVALCGPAASPAISQEQRVAIGEARRCGRGLTAGDGRQHCTWRQELAAIEGRHVRRVECADDWLHCATEWGAAVRVVRAVREWRRRREQREVRDVGLALRGFRKWGLAVCRCPDVGLVRRKEQRVAARLAREAKTRNKERQAAHFAVYMGVEGDGNITLAPGLEDVEVNFRRRRRSNWRAPGRRNRKRSKRARGEAGGRGRAEGSDDGGWSSDGSESAGSQSGEGTGDSGSDGDFEEADGDDGCGGEGSASGVVVGDLLRIWWVEERVWFRCRVVGMGRGGDIACVRYLVDERWGDYYHSLTEVAWETWSTGGEVDPEEARYELDTWVEPVDHEAVAAAEASGGRRERGSRGDGRGGEGGGSRVGEEELSCGSDGGGGGGGSGRTASGGGGTSTGETSAQGEGRFEWVIRSAPKGSGLKKRKALLRALADAWCAAARESGEARPAVGRMVVYRAMKGTMAAKQVAAELKILAREGLVVTDGDRLRCGVERVARCAATDDTAAVEPVSSVDGSGGARRGAKRVRVRPESCDTCETTEETGETGDDSGGGGRGRRALGRRRKVASYVESEQDSDSSGADDWT